MALDPDIQKHFDYKFVEGELHMFVSKDLVDSLGWTEKELDMSFGGIKRMNSFKDAHLSIHKKGGEYEHPWDTHMTNSKPTQGGRHSDLDAL
jgi:hypothetical protein